MRDIDEFKKVLVQFSTDEIIVMYVVKKVKIEMIVLSSTEINTEEQST